MIFSFFSNFSFLENSNLMAGSCFKKLLRLVVCKTSFYLFIAHNYREIIFIKYINGESRAKILHFLRLLYNNILQYMGDIHRIRLKQTFLF